MRHESLRQMTQLCCNTRINSCMLLFFPFSQTPQMEAA